MKIVASNSLTLSNVNDGTITHTAYAYSADGTDRFTTAYPNLNLSNNTQLNYDNLPTGISNGGGTDKSEKIAITDLSGFSWGRKYTPSTRVSQSGMRVVTDVSKLKIGDTITNSYWVKNTGNRPIKFLAQIGFRYGNETEPSEGVSTGWNYTSGSDIEVKNDGKWTKLTFTTIIPQPTVASNRTGDILKSVVHYAYSSGAMMPLAVTDTFIISPLKLEPGSTATPWMPSSSEVTTADWPSYIGQYSDFTATASTDPAKYAPWTVFKGKDGATGPQGPQGLKGDPGATGIPGQAGADGKTSYLHIAYATNSTGTAGFDVSNATGKTYIGQYTDFTSADSTDPSKYKWSLIKGDKGDKGDQGPTGPVGSNGDPGKIVSDTEPTTKFKGLTWKYSGFTAITASDGTNIQPNTEYYWNGSSWIINLINAQNINVDKLTALTANLGDATAGSLTVEKGTTGGIAVKDGLVKSWDISKVIDPKYPDGYSYTSMGVALDSGGLTIYSTGYGYTLDKGGVIDPKYKVASLQAIAGNGRQSSSTGLVLNVTNSNFPFTINGNIDVIGGMRQTSKTTSITIGAGLTLSLERRGEMVIAILMGTINSSLTSGQQFSVGKIPVGYQPNKTVNIPAHMTSSYNNAHIDAGIDGTCTWWGASASSGAPRGTQMWFTDDALPN